MDRNFDSFFKELVRERIEEMPCPPKEEVWEQIKARLRAERKKERRKHLLKRLKLVFAVCIAIAFFTVLYVNFQTPVMAFTNNIIKSIMVIKGDTIKIYKKVVNADEDTHDYLFGRDIDDPRIGEAQKKVHFRMFIPEFIPKDFKLNSVDMLSQYEKRETVTFLYLNSDSDKKECFEIIQRSYPNGADVTLNIKTDDNTKIEHLSIEGIEYTLISYEKNLNGVLWDSGNIGCEINGNINRDDILKVAKSMK